VDSGVYAIINMINGRSYVGQSGRMWPRWYYYHYKHLTENKHWCRELQEDWNTQGADAFWFQPIANITSHQIDRREVEQRWIDRFTTLGGVYNVAKAIVGPDKLGVTRVTIDLAISGRPVIANN
jgi:group I intron endonuclease